MPTGDVMRVAVRGVFAGEPVQFDLGFISQSGAADFPADAIALGSELAPALGLVGPGGPFLAPLSEHYTVNDLLIQDVNPGVSASFPWAIGQPGANVTDDALPPSLGLCVTWRTGLKGKENRGRVYLTGFAEDSQNAGYWIPEIQEWAAANFAQPLIDAFGPVGTGNYQLAVIHTQSGGVRIIPPTATPILTYTVNNTVRNQRRRGVGVRISRRRTGP